MKSITPFPLNYCIFCCFFFSSHFCLRPNHRYLNAQLGNGERPTDLNLAERVRRELNTALSAPSGNSGSYHRSSGTYTVNNVGNGVSCTTECRLLSGQRTQAEIDAMARQITNQIVTDIQSGKLSRNQVNQPNWFENRISEQLTDLQQQHQTEFERNLQSVSNRFHQNREQLNVQSQQQQQSQGSHFQQQSQIQHNIGYVQPVSTGSSYEKVVEERHNERNSNAIYPTIPIIRGATILDQNNCTDRIFANVFPHFNVQNQLNQRTESNRQINSGSYVAPIIRGGSTYHVSETVERKEHRVPQVPVIIPAQNSYTRQLEEERREVHRQRPQVYGINRQEHSSHVESSSIRNVQIVTPAPIPVSTNIRYDIYDHHRESEVVPNYRPRVVLDKNTKFHELEVRNRQYESRPVIPASSSTTHVKEEEQFDRQYQQKPIFRPQVSQTVTKEEIEVDQQKVQQPNYIPQSNTVTHTENEDVRTVHRTSQPQYPVFSHTSSVKSFNESHNSNQHTETIYRQPSGQTVTTIKETHFVKILPQPATHYTIQYTEQEYTERLNRIQQELRRLGYGVLSEEEYNATIASGGFVHNGYKYLYNADRGRYEKTERVDVNEEEYHSLLRGLQNQLQQIGVQMTEHEYNQTIEDGYFIKNGVRYNFDSETGSYNRQEIDEEHYEILRNRIQDESNRQGWSLTNHEINQTIATGVLVINGHRYILNKQSGTLEQGEDLQISEQEYRTILRRLQEQLVQLGFEQMTEREYNHTISTGYFVRGGQKYRYNADIGRYEKVELTNEEYYTVTKKLKETLQRLNYRQMSEHELNNTIATGTFIRGGYQWSYNSETGEATAIRIAAPFEEISDSEYTSIFRRLQYLLRRLGYPEMSETECNSTIISGTFSRGGNQWVYQPSAGEFQRIELSEREYNYRVERLIEILTRLGVQKSSEEHRDIIERGNFYHGGHRYEYDSTSGSFVRIQMSEAEYQERVRQLLDQLQQIGYGTMSESECRATINSGVFYYGGHEWVYNYQSRQYEMGKESDKENGIVDDNYFSNIGLDSTKYGTSKTDEQDKINSFDIDKENNRNNRRKEIINKNRGDQPPQTFEEDYDESEEVTQRPITRPTQAATRPPFISTMRPIPVQTLEPYTNELDHQRYQSERQQTIYAIPTPQTEYEERYHHKKTTYTKTSGYVS